MQLEGQAICEDGDPAVLADLPTWAKVPPQVKILTTNVLRQNGSEGIGYTAEYRGPLADIEPVFRAQIESQPGMRLAPQDGSTMLVARKDGDSSGTYLSLTPQKTSDGLGRVEINFVQQTN